MKHKGLMSIAFISAWLFSTLASADIQKVTPSRDSFQVNSGDTIEFSVNYAASSPNKTTGLGLKINYDSGQLQLIDVSEVFAKDKIAQAEGVEKTTESGSTDKSINIAWVSLNGSWPAAATTENGGIKLLTVTFKVTDGFTSSTIISMTGNAAAGNSFQSTPITIKSVKKAETGSGGAMPWIILLLLSLVFVKTQIETV